MGRVIPISKNNLGGNYEPIPAGVKVPVSIYEIEESAVRNGENAGKPQAVVTFKVTEGQYAGREIRYNNFALYDGKGAWATAALASAIGLPTNEDNQPIFPDNLKDLLGKQLTVKVGHRTDQNDPSKVYNTTSGYESLKPVEQPSGGTTPGASLGTDPWSR